MSQNSDVSLDNLVDHRLRQKKKGSIIDYIRKNTHKDFFEDGQDDGVQEQKKSSKRGRKPLKKSLKKRIKGNSSNNNSGDDGKSSQKGGNSSSSERKKEQKKATLKATKKSAKDSHDSVSNQSGSSSGEGEDDEHWMMKKLPSHPKLLQKLLIQTQEKLKFYRLQFFNEQFEKETKKSKVSETAVPVCSDVTQFNFSLLREKQLEFGTRLFDVIMMDPPWQLSSSQPSRGVAIAYDNLSDDQIMNMPIPTLQTDGFIFIWAINAKYRFSIKLIEHWGYQLIDEITWIQQTVNGKIAKGHGFYLQHAKESCLVGVKGNVNTKRFQQNIASDIIFSQRRGQSQKPQEIYEYVEELVPDGYYLEIFGRRNNIRQNWVTIGNEL